MGDLALPPQATTELIADRMADHSASNTSSSRVKSPIARNASPKGVHLAKASDQAEDARITGAFEWGPDHTNDSGLEDKQESGRKLIGIASLFGTPNRCQTETEQCMNLRDCAKLRAILRSPTALVDEVCCHQDPGREIA